MFVAACVSLQAADIVLRPGMSPVRVEDLPLLEADRQIVPDGDAQGGSPLQILSKTPFDWFADREGRVELLLKSGKDNAEDVTVTIWDWRDQPVWRETFSVPCRETLSFRLEGRGVYRLVADRLDERGHALSRQIRSFVALPDNRSLCADWSYDEFMLGICAFPERLHWGANTGKNLPEGMSFRQAMEQGAELAARAGFGSVRLEYVANGGAPYLKNSRDPMDLYSAMGLSIFVKLQQQSRAMLLPHYQQQLDAGTLYGPAWQYPKVREANEPLFREAFRESRDIASFYEILNEPDYAGTSPEQGFWKGTVREYIDIADYALELHEQYAPEVLISHGGLTHLSQGGGKISLEPAIEITKALQSRLDLYAYHSHGTVQELIAEKARVYEVLRRSGFDPDSVPQQNSEGGYCPWRLDLERNQAVALPKKILYGWAHGDNGIHLYELRDKGGSRRNLESEDWGILDHFFCPKPAYGTVAALAELLAGAQLKKIVYEGDLFHLYEFRQGNDLVLALMNMKEAEDGDAAVSLKMRLPKSAVLLDELGNSEGAGSEWVINDFVKYVKIEEASAVSVSLTESGGRQFRLSVR